MDELGDIFGSISSIAGLQLIYYIAKWKIYLFGENHSINGDTKNNKYILDIIEEYAITHPNINIKLLVELTKESIYIHVHNNNPISPLSTYANELYKHHYFPKNVSTIFADIRRVPPFNILESIYDYNSFAFIYDLTNNIDPRVLHEKTKLFEKDFFKHTNTSVKCIEFFKSIIIPTVEQQSWFTNYLKEFNMSSESNIIKTKLSSIQSSNKFAYNYINKIITEVLEHAILNHNQYSNAMNKAENTRHTNSSNFVEQKHKYFKAFWIHVNSLLMDIYMLCLIFTKESNDIYITLTGVNHTNTIINAIKGTVVSAYNVNANIHKKDIIMKKQIWKLAHEPKSLLHNFINNINNINNIN